MRKQLRQHPERQVDLITHAERPLGKLIGIRQNVIEAANGNLFMVLNGQLITPPITEGCLNGIMRKQILRLSKELQSIEILEKAISPFDLQKADELFITNVIVGIQSVTKYRKKEFENSLAKQLLDKLNQLLPD